MYYAVCLFDLPYHIDRFFDYSSDLELAPGTIVRLPFGRQNSLRLGIIMKRVDSPETDVALIKPIHSVFSAGFSLSEKMMRIALFLKEHTLCTFSEAVKCILPPGALNNKENVKYRRTVVLNIPEDEARAIIFGEGKGRIRSEGQREALAFLLGASDADYELLRAQKGVTPAVISALAKKGLVRIESTESVRNPYLRYAAERDTSEIFLSSAQGSAYEEIMRLYSAGAPRAGLLFGVTGSGKTKVIMKSIDRVIADGRSVIMLVPEISLTPQTVSIFCKRYGERVAVIHSSLSAGERLDAYRRIRRGEVDLVIGTRSAIFAPLENLGMVVIDEEHEHTYKSEQNPKYHARDIAAFLAGEHKCLMLLASATPSLESFYKAKSGAYTLIPIRERYGGFKLPEAIIVDMREEVRLGNPSPLSNRLLKKLNEVYDEENQAIIFLNRRGYSSEISCRGCGEVISCPRCSVSLTYHTSESGGKLLCHLCGHSEPVPKSCPSCGEEKLAFLGYGTQKLEGEINKYLPDMRVMRMDADTTSGKMAYDKMLSDFREGEADILLGTQMVAKGHDFPRVSLVGVALADTSLYVSDFRAAERTFSLLTQVIGRAGRSMDGGVAVIQTYSPTNEVIRLACLQDYERFYEGEIALRREMSYPPFCDMVSLTLTSDDEREVLSESVRLSESIREKIERDFSKYPFIVYGPFEAEIYKLNEKYRMRMVVKCKLNSKTRELYSALLKEYSVKRGVILSIDFNSQ
ncbi:MAG: primosomal protein N' [Clostridia bacterium]|nr:primosomal protein N' [Clostridia bacterium]